jgi:hypothetical protein
VNRDDARLLRQRFEDASLTPDEFRHEQHLIAALDCVRTYGPEIALDRFRRGLQQFLARHGVPASRYHETRTVAWLRLVAHVNDVHGHKPYARLREALLRECGDASLLSRHYSDALLESDAAREAFAEPDLLALPGDPAPWKTAV